MIWECAAGCSTSFTSKNDLACHLETHHANLAPTHLESLIGLSERPGSGFRESKCPLCSQKLTTESRYQEHIGRHQEWIALFTLPTKSHFEDKDPETTSHDSEEAVDNSAIHAQSTEGLEATLADDPPEKERISFLGRATSSRGQPQTQYRPMGMATSMKGSDLRWICVRTPKT